MYCKHKNWSVKMTELSGGVIYRAMICDKCGRELGHTTFDPVTQGPETQMIDDRNRRIINKRKNRDDVK